MIKNFKVFFSISILGAIFFSSLNFLSNLTNAKEREVILIAAASNLKFAMDDIIKIFEKKKSGINVKSIYGSSGNFFNQILNGAPFDIYFSADSRYPKELKKKQLGGEVTTYAFGRIVLMAPENSDIRIQTLGIKSLFHPSVKKIAIANPTHAPYGRAAVSFMRGHNIYEKLKGKLVMGENISQAAQFVESGALEVGIIALSIAIKARELGHVAYWEIPIDTYSPIEQEFIILRRTKKLKLVRDFTDFIKSGEGKSILVKYGFDVQVASKQ